VNRAVVDEQQCKGGNGTEQGVGVRREGGEVRKGFSAQPRASFIDSGKRRTEVKRWRLWSVGCSVWSG
jgi:hypothetical protein